METISNLITYISNCSSLTGAACFAALYTIYYFVYLVKCPQVACGDRKLREFLTTHCPISTEKFCPTWWCVEPRFQTVLRALIQSSPKVLYETEKLVTPDNGEILLDWVENDKNPKYSSEERPTIIFLPGLTGSSRENYILHMVHDAEEAGYRCVVFNNRGTGDGTLKTPRTYCAANIEDAEFVIDHIKKKHPKCPLLGVGVSLGGNIIFNYMAHKGEKTVLDSAIALSATYNLHETAKSLNKTLNFWLFNRRLTRMICKIFKKNLTLFENQTGIDTAHVLKSTTIKEFDDRFTSKIFGYQTVEDYYTDASLHTKIHQLARPMLCLSAADDPFAPHFSIPVKEAEENENIAIVVTSHGGHIGFLEGFFPRDKNYMYRWVKQFTSAIVDHGIKKE